MHAPTPTRTPTKKSRRAFWLKQLHMWHWMSSAISLIGLLLFAITGFTLNHAADIEGAPRVAERSAQLPAPLLEALAAADPAGGKGALPGPVAAWVEANFPVRAGEAEWSADEVYMAAPSLFIDIFAFACLVFALTGLVLLQLHSAKRKSTWPLVGAGVAIPAAIAILFIH